MARAEQMRRPGIDDGSASQRRSAEQRKRPPIGDRGPNAIQRANVRVVRRGDWKAIADRGMERAEVR